MESEEDFIKNFNNFNKQYNLYKENEVLYIKFIENKNWLPFCIDFSSNKLITRLKQTGIHSDLAKAIGIKGNFKPKILDATAGLGRDSFILASLGCEIVMLERNKLIYFLLRNALDRSKNITAISSAIQRMTLLNQDSITYLKEDDIDKKFDVIYVDPMFPKNKKTRLVKKDMQIFREIVGDDLDSKTLFQNAIETNIKRIVVKRMLKDNYISNITPSFEIKGTVTRFDVYIKKL